MFINSRIEHRIISEDMPLILLLVEPESRYARSLTQGTGPEFSIVDTDPHLITDLVTLLRALDPSPGKVLGLLFRHWHLRPSVPGGDERIRDTLRHVRSRKDLRISVGELADKVFLSESRFQHLFSEQVGIPVKRYLLRCKMLAGVSAIVSGQDFTSAAHAAGFSDSAHMSRSFRALFGMSLSGVFKNSRSVQVFDNDFE